MKDGDCDISKVQIQYYKDDYRALHAAQDIAKGDTIYYIPRDQVLSSEVIRDSKFCRTLINKGLKDIPDEKVFFSVYILTEKAKAKSKFGPYLDMLPQNLSRFPIFFNKKELKYLEGSPVLDAIS